MYEKLQHILISLYVFGCAIGYEVGGLRIVTGLKWVTIGVPLETVINTKDILKLVKKMDCL